MQQKTLGYLAFAFISLVWGTTYLVTHIGVLHFPAVLFTGVRQLVAGIILLAALLLFRAKFTWSWKDVYPQIIAGVLVITLGNGIVSWALHFIPSGLSALICTLIPINMIVISLLVERKQKLNSLITLGLLFGVAGMGFIFKDNIADIARPEYLLGIVLTLIATICWSAGSLYSKNKSVAGNPLYKAAIQMVTGGVVLLIISFFMEDWKHIPIPDASTLWALGYLIIMGSTLAFAAYQYALATLPSGVVSVYAYINPLVALLLGYSVLNEKLTWYTLIALLLTVTGIYFINKGYKQQAQAQVKNKKISFSSNTASDRKKVCI